MGANWPEFKSCFGCMSLHTGVYITAITGFILMGISFTVNMVVLPGLFKLSREVFDGEFHNDNRTELIETFQWWSAISISYYCTWTFLQFIVLFTTLILLYGVWKNKPKFLNLYLIIYSPYWFLSVINSVVPIYFFGVFVKAAACIMIFLDLYRLLVIRSAYREMTGKRRFLDSNSEIHNEINENITYRFESPPDYEGIERSKASPHCSSCTCNGRRRSTEQTVETPVVDNSDNSDTSTSNLDSEVKVINVKEEAVIYDQDQLQGCSSSVVENIDERLSNGAVNNNGMSLKKKEKGNIDDEPIIFDQNQLNIGTSPILEDISDNNCIRLRKQNVQFTESNRQDIQHPELNNKCQEHSDENNKDVGQHSTNTTATEYRPERPTVLQINKDISQKVINQREDIPVIYDENQLNMSSSPIIEDSIVNRNVCHLRN